MCVLCAAGPAAANSRSGSRRGASSNGTHVLMPEPVTIAPGWASRLVRMVGRSGFNAAWSAAGVMEQPQAHDAAHASNEASPVVNGGRLSAHALRPRNHFAGDSITQVPRAGSRARASTLTVGSLMTSSPARPSRRRGGRRDTDRPSWVPIAPRKRTSAEVVAKSWRSASPASCEEASTSSHHVRSLPGGSISEPSARRIGGGAIPMPEPIDHDAPVNGSPTGYSAGVSRSYRSSATTNITNRMNAARASAIAGTRIWNALSPSRFEGRMPRGA